MKNLLLLFSIILFPTLNYGQKWHLEKINSESVYKYEYWFSFQNEDDTNSFEIIEN